jgi:hypothetical protein
MAPVKIAASTPSRRLPDSRYPATKTSAVPIEIRATETSASASS